MKEFIVLIFFVLIITNDVDGRFVNKNEDGNEIEDQIFCEASNVGRGKGIDSKWCDDNCKNGRHPACKSIGDEKQLCVCKNKDIALETKNCRQEFQRIEDTSIKCFVFDDTDCVDEEFGFGLVGGETLSLNETSKYINNVAAVAAKVGCYLEFWTGKNFTGHEFILSNRAPRVANSKLVEGELDTGIHVSFNEFLSLGKLKNKIQSFKCICR